MGRLTEREIIDCLHTNIKSAISDCDMLATIPQKGPTYIRLRESLKLIEGACIQMAYWRDGDTRWLKFGDLMEEAHQRSLTWLRNHHPRKLFTLLAHSLRGLQAVAHDLETRSTGQRSGPILPIIGPDPTQRNRSIVVPRNIEHKTAGGLIIPAGVTV